MSIELNKVYNTDCIPFMKEMISQNIKAHCCMTDIPYNELNKFKEGGLRRINCGNADVLTFDIPEFLTLLDSIITNSFVIFCGWEQFSKIVSFFTSKGYTTRPIVYNKVNPSVMNGEHAYLNAVELAVYAKKPSAPFNNHCKSNVLSFPLGGGPTAIHPTQKNMKLWSDIMKDISNQNDIIFDPCMGSFTTAIVARFLDRQFLGCEMDRTFFEAGTHRLKVSLEQPTFDEMLY